jgi:cell division septal protein FtsQ
MKRRIKANKRRITRRRKKSIFTNFYFSFAVFASIILLSGAGFLLFSPRFQISQLSVTGNNNIATEDLQKAAQEKLKTSFSVLGMDISTESIFLSMGKGVSGLMESFPEIEKVTIKKNFPNGVSLQIVEKTPYAVWTDEFDNSKCYLVDKSGSFIKNYEEKKEYASLLKINEKEEINDLNKKKVLESLSKIENELAKYSIITTEFDLYKSEAVIVQTSSSCEIIFYIGNDKVNYADLDWQIEKLAALAKNGYLNNLSSLKYIKLIYENQTNICGVDCAGSQ